jgi:DNA-binding SARP family transcriptional activator
MLTLRTFGGLSVAGSGTSGGVAPQRRQLALLALLAGARGVSRDKLLAYLWPESDAERSRHALNQALYALRRDLGADAVLTAGAELRLNPAAITADVAELEAALECGDGARAAALYAGPFLDGFFLEDAPEFERWVDAERARLAHRASAAMESLATAAAARGDHHAAAGWWRRLADADPLNSRLALLLIRSLAASGDRAGALRHATSHAALLREELDVPPDPQITAIARRLRSADDEVPHARPLQPAARSALPPMLGAAAAESSRRYLDHLRHALADRYEVGERLERGGASTAFRAKALSDGSAVTLRVVHPTLAALLDVRRFVADLRRLAPVAHPAIARLVDVGEADSVVYYASAPVDGGALRARLAADRQLPLGEALRIAREVAGGLAASHAAGVLHLDLKPRHVLLASRSATVSELGVAPAIAAAAGEALTHSGVTLGTPAYMSPEQAAGEKQLDARSDIYSLGCILYHMLAGEPPFAGPTAQAVLTRRLTEPVPPLRASRGSVSPALERVLSRMVARVPADRFPTAAEAEAALEDVLNAEPTRDAAQQAVSR